MSTLQLPSRKEFLWCVSLWVIYFIVASLFVGLRPDNVLLPTLFIFLFCLNGWTRRLAVALLPFVLFGISYDWLRLYPNYMVNEIDVKSINDAERALFGITTANGVVTPNEFFVNHHCVMADMLSGVFYLCWVPVPMAFGLYLYFTGRRSQYAHFAWAFLFVNLVGFIGYYVHPAAPPWYVMQYGYEPILNTPGCVAGLARFDEMVGVNIFKSIYSENANIFAAVPSLHSAYVLIASVYAFRSKIPHWMSILLFLISAGIWFAAVYTSHHYVIDVLLGILTALLGISAIEVLAKYCAPVSNFFSTFTKYIQSPSK